MRGISSKTTIGSMIVAILLSASSVQATTVTLDPGADGTSFLFKDFFFNDLAGTNYDGQTIGLDVVFSGAFLVTPLLNVNLNLNQASGLGVSPTTGFSVSGYLLDGSGQAANAPTTMPLTGTMPGQLHPGWPYTLADGQHYLPATTNYEFTLRGASTMAPGALVDPIIFSGIHFDITMPDTLDALIGARMSIASYGSGYTFRQPVDSPILVSPAVMPTYTVPEASSSLLLLSTSLIALAALRRYQSGKHR